MIDKVDGASKIKKGNTTLNTYNAIRQSIINLNLIPGTAISENEISQAYHVSRTPVREAFIKLERERLLIILPQRGSFVSKISVSKSIEEQFLRETVEMAVFQEYMSSPSREGYNQLSACLEKQKELLISKDYKTLSKYDDLFHEVFFNQTDNTFSGDILKTNLVNYQRLRVLSVKDEENVASANVEQHEMLLDAIFAQNIEAATKVYLSHLRKVFAQIEDMRKTYPDYFVE